MSASDQLSRRHALTAAAARARRGMSLVELMVGVVVALLVGLAATGSAQQFSAAQRQGFGVGAAAVSSLATLASLESDIALAGLGFFGDAKPLCTSLNLSVGASMLSNGDTFSPLLLARSSAANGSNPTDQLDVVHASLVESGTAVMLATDSDGSAADLASMLPASVGQTVLLAPATPGTACTLRTVTAVTAATATTPQHLVFGAAGAHNQKAFANSVAYPANSRIAVVGALQWMRYRINAGQLIVEQPLANASAVLLRNVIGFRVELGVSAVGSTTLAGWHSAADAGWTTLDQNNIGRVRALRLGVVSRVDQREKTGATGTCSASSAKPTLFGATVEPDVSDWSCYRYRSTAIVVPLRNIVFGTQS
jgi:type IV pilus assembly protein PilW